MRKSPQTLGSALSTLMAMDAPSIRRDPTPAKPGWFWFALDDGESFEPSEWYNDVGERLGRLGSGPYLMMVAQDMDGSWFGWLPHGGLVEIGENIGNRRIRLSYLTTVAYQPASVSAELRITWLGEAPSPGLPDQVEPI